jgi:hypothetical protein
MTDEETPLDADELMNFAERIEALPPADAEWVGALFQECLRARTHEAELIAAASEPRGNGAGAAKEEAAQLALDCADWLKTLWDVGYMGAASFPAPPRSAFPVVELEDVLKSALFARIREGKRPLPFPPPTRQGLPWHDLLEAAGEHRVAAEIVRDEQGAARGAIVEACADWRIVGEVAAGHEFLVQHHGKGPIFRLFVEAPQSRLRREPPTWTRTIRLQERGGFRSYALDWPQDSGAVQAVPLRAATWERAESEAAHWIAGHHPHMYGQVRFDRVSE